MATRSFLFFVLLVGRVVGWMICIHWALSGPRPSGISRSYDFRDRTIYLFIYVFIYARLGHAAGLQSAGSVLRQVCFSASRLHLGARRLQLLQTYYESSEDGPNLDLGVDADVARCSVARRKHRVCPLLYQLASMVRFRACAWV